MNAAEQALNEVTSEPDDANSSVKRKHHEAAVEWDSDDDEGHATGADEGHATGAASEDSNESDPDFIFLRAYRVSSQSIAIF